MNKFHNYFNKR